MKLWACFLVLVLLAPAAVAAQDDEAELKKLGAYQLTVANVRKTKVVIDELAKVKEEPPARGEGETLDAAVREIEANPKLMGVLRTAGLSAKDFMMTLATVMTAGLLVEMPTEQVPAYLRTHVKFMKDNEKEMAPLMKTLFGG